MPKAQVGELTLEYELHGPPDGVPLLAIMGLGMPGAAWPQPLVDLLTARGARVVTFDNRDTGGSTRFNGARTIPPLVAMLRAMLRRRMPAPYTLHALADDAVGLLDALGVGRAHVVGISMGGMVAQLVAAKYPQRTASLTSIMSSTGNPSPRVTWAKPRALRALLSRPERPDDPQAVVDHLERLFSVIGSPAAGRDRAELRGYLERVARRGLDSAASRRHLIAVLATGDRRDLLRQITAPTLVLHGRLDPLIPPAAGAETARSIPGARLVVIEGMGHDLAPSMLPRLAAEIAAHIGLPAARA
jgi:pimeloyl-ACP methyl ester carboxylesterase